MSYWYTRDERGSVLSLPLLRENAVHTADCVGARKDLTMMADGASLHQALLHGSSDIAILEHKLQP